MTISSAEMLTCNERNATQDDEQCTIKCSAVSTLERGIPDTDFSEQTNELKRLILADFESEPEKFDENDIREVKTNLWATQRYLLRTKLNVESAHKLMNASLQFKNSADINIKQFPIEYYQVGAVFSYERDRKNNVVVYLRCKMNKKIPLVTRFSRAFFTQTLYKADAEAEGKGIVIVFDLQGAGLSNVDMEFLYFIISSLAKHFPKGLSYFLIHEIPWVLRSILTISKQMMPEEFRDLIKFSTNETIYEYITKENLPDFMGGTCTRNYRHVPKTAITLKQMANIWNLDEEELQVIRKKYADCLPKQIDEQELQHHQQQQQQQQQVGDCNKVKVAAAVTKEIAGIAC